jgi:hypothetical protein
MLDPYLGLLTLNQINGDVIWSVVQGELKKGNKPATVNRYLALIRSLLRMARDEWLHTLPGALGVAAIVALFGRQSCEYALRWWNRQLAPGWQTRWLAVDPPISKTTAWVSALVGTLSHIALDSIMHVDVEALWPFVAGNSVQGVISLGALHGACIGAALLALAIWIVAKRTGLYRSIDHKNG